MRRRFFKDVGDGDDGGDGNDGTLIDPCITRDRETKKQEKSNKGYCDNKPAFSSHNEKILPTGILRA